MLQIKMNIWQETLTFNQDIHCTIQSTKLERYFFFFHEHNINMIIYFIFTKQPQPSEFLSLFSSPKLNLLSMKIIFFIELVDLANDEHILYFFLKLGPIFCRLSPMSIQDRPVARGGGTRWGFSPPSFWQIS